MRKLAAAGLALLAGCGPTPMSTMAPKSDFANAIHSLYMEVIALDTFILVVVVTAMFLALLYFTTRSEKTPEELPVDRDHFALEVAWTVGPALIILAIAIPTIRTTFRSQPSKPPKNALIVKVTAHQWWWQIDYPSLKIATANEIHLPVGRPVQFQLHSADVIHSFWVPALGGKRDVIPGHTNTLTMTPDAPGEYYGQCAEFCGLSHANMRMRVFVQTPKQFRTWVAAQKAPAVIPPTSDVEAAAGAQVYARSPCVTCHTVRGVSTQKVGPDLTHFGSRTTFAGATLDNTPQNLEAWLHDPDRLKPGAQMPTLGLTKTQIAELTAYLESLK